MRTHNRDTVSTRAPVILEDNVGASVDSEAVVLVLDGAICLSLIEPDS